MTSPRAIPPPPGGSARACSTRPKPSAACHIAHRGGPVRRRPGVRKLVLRPYLIFYRVDDAARRVDVLRFWHGAQDPRGLRLE